ncbi:hypothetical protein F8388_026643 [Cannabis sativa]|uniref:Uncharacterized protein n=1 Tax=Cannabis sativa TaxID=3483 RepID=A0A7J6EAA4_CANSA|nr:hypothetical protein F8388_026643 [Cannabis sativa]
MQCSKHGFTKIPGLRSAKAMISLFNDARSVISLEDLCLDLSMSMISRCTTRAHMHVPLGTLILRSTQVANERSHKSL